MSHSHAPTARADVPTHPVVRAVGWLSEAAGIVAGIALVVATFVTAWGVFVRYVLRQPTVWQTETTIYLLILVTFVGAAYGVKHHAHVGVDLVVERLPLRGRLVMRMITAVAVIVVVLAVLWTSFEAWHTAYAMDHRSATAWRAPLWIPYAFLPLGMALVVLQYLAMIFEGVLALQGKIPLEQASLISGTSELAQVEAELEGEEPVTLDRGTVAREEEGR